MSSSPKDLSPKNEATDRTEQTSDSTAKPAKPVDITNKIGPMQMHELMSIPQQDVKITLTGVETEFLLGSLHNLHFHLVQTIRDPKATKEERNSAYGVALTTEKLYANIFEQLKIKKVDREELH